MQPLKDYDSLRENICSVIRYTTNLYMNIKSQTGHNIAERNYQKKE